MRITMEVNDVTYNAIDICATTVLAPGESTTCTFTHNVSGSAGDTITDEVTANGTDDEGDPVSDSDTADVRITDAESSIEVIKTADPTSLTEPGGDVTFTVDVTNTSAVDTITLTTIEDDEDNDGVNDVTYNAIDICATTVLAPGESTTCTFTHNVSGSAGDTITDEVTANGTDDEGDPVSDSDTADVRITDAESSIEVIKTADPTSLTEPGGDVTFTVDVTNTSAVDTITLTTIEDDEDNDGVNDVTYNAIDICATTVLAPGESTTCTFTHNVSGSAGDTITDEVTANGTDDEGDPVSDSDTADVRITDAESSIEVIKTADPTSLTEPGGDVTFTVDVTNTSTVDTITLTTIEDDEDNDGVNDVTYNAIDICATTVLAPGESTTCTFTHNVSGSAGDTITDEVTANGTDDEGDPVSDSDTADVRITDAESSIEVIKTADPTSLTEPGGDVTFTVDVTNTSTVDTITLTTIEDDEDNDGVNDVTYNAIDICATTVLAPGESTTCTFTHNVSGSAGDTITDEVTANGTDDEGDPVSDSDTADVRITDAESSIEVIKTADPTSLTEPGGDVTFTVDVTNTSAVDTITLTTIEDDEDNDGVNDVTYNAIDICATTVLAPGESTTCTFTHNVSGSAGDTITDEVTANGTDDEGDPVSDSDTADVRITDAESSIEVIKTADPTSLTEPGGDVTFTVDVTNTSTVDTITLTTIEDDEDNDGVNDVTYNAIDICATTVLAPGESTTCTFTHNVSGSAGDTITDEVTANGTDDEGDPVSDSDTADVRITDAESSIEVIKTADPTSLTEPGGDVTFTVDVTNTSTVDTITLTTIEDDEDNDGSK